MHGKSLILYRSFASAAVSVRITRTHRPSIKLMMIVVVMICKDYLVEKVTLNIQNFRNIKCYFVRVMTLVKTNTTSIIK